VAPPSLNSSNSSDKFTPIPRSNGQSISQNQLKLLPMSFASGRSLILLDDQTQNEVRNEFYDSIVSEAEDAAQWSLAQALFALKGKPLRAEKELAEMEKILNKYSKCFEQR